MKNTILKSSLLIAILGIALWSCNKDNKLPLEATTKVANVSQSLDLLNNFEETYNESNISPDDLVQFDFSQLHIVGDPENNQFLVNQMDYDPNLDMNFGLTMALNEYGEFVNPMILQTNSETHQINYYNVEFVLQMTVNLNVTNQTVSVTHVAIPGAQGSWGQNTMDCITDAYSNHGWISVWAWVQTAFIPMTGAAIAASCAMANVPSL
tara:strand:- start:670 stop:1296 length:627 start_codon:yes stop_codon:yes gene_type:complete